ncbi:hypothetical protein [Chryseolinea soli]|uniref:Uncharacterized protein n=1 Tax=Chryseolinea soli TaxID=2321403 RepID=A0A385SFI5_9BACT|nr:hypothetical protein [Chryseolinea soli]AYB29652.1 hypothetical protein D4L85_03215 [Chryseolinea soli]
MVSISADEFRALMIAGGIIENKKVSEPVNTMFTTFERPFTIKNCKLVSLLFNDCPLHSIAIEGNTHIDIVTLAGAQTNFNSFTTDASPVITTLNIGGAGNAQTVAIHCKVRDLTFEECSIRAITTNATQKMATLSLKRNVDFNTFHLTGLYGTVQLDFSSGAELTCKDTQITHISAISTIIQAYHFTDHEGTSLSFDSLSFKKARSMAFVNSSFLKIRVEGDQNRLFQNLTVTLTGN